MFEEDEFKEVLKYSNERQPWIRKNPFVLSVFPLQGNSYLAKSNKQAVTKRQNLVFFIYQKLRAAVVILAVVLIDKNEGWG